MREAVDGWGEGEELVTGGKKLEAYGLFDFFFYLFIVIKLIILLSFRNWQNRSLK